MTRTLALLLALSLAGCGAAGSTQSAYQRGVAALEAGQPRTARIEFLNAIKANPGSPTARIAQARTYLALGDAVAAEAELAHARRLRTPEAEIAHLLAYVFVLQGRPQDALQAAGKAAPAHAAYAARMRARAHAMLGDVAAANASFDEALELTPKSSDLWTDIASFRRSTGELAEALAAADRAVALNPRNAQAMMLRGELTRSQYGLKAALPWFDRALEIDEDNIPALLERAATLAELGQMSAMLADTRKVLSLHRDHPMAYYLQSVLAARAHDFRLAQSLYKRTAGRFDGQPAGMLLVGAIDHQLGNHEQAVRRLTPLVAMQPENSKARRLLAGAQLATGDAIAAFRTIQPAADRPDADSYSLTLMARAMHKLGDSNAAFYFARAALPFGGRSEPFRAVDGAALDALRNAARRGGAEEQVRLVRGLLASGLGDEALDRALALQLENPGAPDAHVLVGDAYAVGGNFHAAAEQYRKAANIAFTEPTAMRLIEALDRSGRPELANRVLSLFLAQNPRSVSAQLLAAGRFMQARQYEQAIAIYEGLRQRLGNRDAAILNNLAWAHGEQGDYRRAILFARKAWSLDRNNPVTTDTLGWLLFKSGSNKALGLALLERAARGAPTDEQIRRHLDSARRG